MGSATGRSSDDTKGRSFRERKRSNRQTRGPGTTSSPRCAGSPTGSERPLVLRYCEDMSEQQTAEVLATSVKAVKGLVTRGLAALRQQEEVSR